MLKNTKKSTATNPGLGNLEGSGRGQVLGYILEPLREVEGWALEKMEMEPSDRLGDPECRRPRLTFQALASAKNPRSTQ